jgi:hypothetical protein
MADIKSKLILDANGRVPAQIYDLLTQQFVLVSNENPQPIRIYPKHTGFKASQGVNGWITTTELSQVIDFSDKPLNSIVIEGKRTNGIPDTILKIQINDESDIWFIEGEDGIEDIEINKITILNDVGTVLKWKGLII